jgi:hypothetical protein
MWTETGGGGQAMFDMSMCELGITISSAQILRLENLTRLNVSTGQRDRRRCDIMALRLPEPRCLS